MSIQEKIHVAAHASVCFVYSLFFSGIHSESLYMCAAVSYAAIALSDVRRH